MPICKVSVHRPNVSLTATGGRTQRHKNSAARCRERLHSLLETLWDAVPESDRNRLRKRNHEVPQDMSRAEKIGIVVAYIRDMKDELKAR